MADIPAPEELQKLCEHLIACRCWAVLTLDDRAFVYDKENTQMDAILIIHTLFWSFKVELFGVEVKVSKPRRLWRLIHSRYKMEHEASYARSVMAAIEQAREVVKKESLYSDERKEEVNA